MNLYNALKKTKVTWNEKESTFDIKGIGYRLITRILTCATLFSYMSEKEIKINNALGIDKDPVDVEREEFFRRGVRALEHILNHTAAGEEVNWEDHDLYDTSDEAMAKWIEFNNMISKDRKEFDIKEATVPDAKSRKAMDVRLEVLMVLEKIGYVSSTVIKLSEGNKYGYLDTALKQIEPLKILLDSIQEKLLEYQAMDSTKENFGKTTLEETVL